MESLGYVCIYVAESVSGCTTRHGRGMETAKLLTGPASLSALFLEGRDGKGAAWHAVATMPPVRHFLCSRQGSELTQGLNK